MIPVKPGQKLPLSVIIPDLTAGLIAKASLEKMDGTVLSTVTLTEVHPGDHKNQTFPMPSGLDFLTAKFAVYLGDGVTPAPGIGSYDELYGVVTPILASSLKVVVGCEDQPTQHPVEVVQTSDKNLLLVFSDDTGAPLDVTGATAILIRLVKADGTVMSKALGSGITLVGGHPDQALVQMVAADFALLPLGDQVLQVEVDLGGEKNVMQVADAISVQPSIA